MGKKTTNPKGDSIPIHIFKTNCLNLSLTAMADRQARPSRTYPWGLPARIRFGKGRLKHAAPSRPRE